nr:pyrroloquinoline-quinone synthase PqqC [Methylocapsa sp. S129]
MTPLMNPQELEAALRQIGATRYHNLHPLHRLMHEGRCTKTQLQAWALNRYYYQAMIPVKDSTILSRIEDAALRRIWRQRIIDHDGEHEADGGIYRWIKLAEGLGLDRELVVQARAILPTTRYAVEAYIHFCATKTLLEAIASSLTELFSSNIIGERVSGMLANYDFVTRETLAYFTARPVQAQRDSDFAIEWVKEHARTVEQQQAVLRALEFKCDVLWAQSDALMHAYVEGHVPPGAWRGEGA